MTVDERLTTLNALWRAARSLVPSRSHEAFTELEVAIEAAYNDHGDERVAQALRERGASAEGALDEARKVGFQAGMLAVKKRSDYRDLDDVQDPEELRRTH